jgi:hypothetical protein
VLVHVRREIGREGVIHVHQNAAYLVGIFGVADVGSYLVYQLGIRREVTPNVVQNIDVQVVEVSLFIVAEYR